VLAGKYNIQGAKALYEESKSRFYPKVDIELSQNYNDNYNEFIGTDDRTQGLLVVSYNLYNGGADEANKLSRLSQMNQEVSVVNNIKRQVIEKVALAWNSYQLSKEQIPFLKQYKAQSKKTLSLYKEEYDIGNRTLLDLISIENDLKRANDELIYTKYNLLQSKYEIMHAMGLTIASILGNQSDYYRRVGIHKPHNNKYTKQETLYNQLDKAIQSEEKDTQTPKKKPLTVKKTQPQEQNIVHPAQKSADTQTGGISSFFDAFKKVRWESR